MPSPDDIANLLVKQPTPAVRYGQGTILAWNPDTFENVIQWRDILLTNLPVLSGTDALTYKFGDTVGLLGWDAGGGQGAGSWWILGRLIVPGEGRGAEAVAWMTSALAREISAAIFADRITTATVEDGATTPTTGSWVKSLELMGTSTPSPGPVVTANISANGTALVFTTSGTCVLGIELGQMAFALDGASTPAPGVSIGELKGNGGPGSLCTNPIGITYVEGLTEGSHTFEAIYQNTGGSDLSPTWADRIIIVIGL